MTATFEVTFGVLECETAEPSKFITKGVLSKFWEHVEGADRRGVYVFGIRASKGWKPLYVGQTKKQTFEARIGQHVTPTGGLFNDILRNIRKGTPVLFLIGRTGKGKNGTSTIDALEIEFINYAFARNPNLYNDRGIKQPKFVIEGFGSRGKPTTAVRDLKAMIGY